MKPRIHWLDENKTKARIVVGGWFRREAAEVFRKVDSYSKTGEWYYAGTEIHVNNRWVDSKQLEHDRLWTRVGKMPIAKVVREHGE